MGCSSGYSLDRYTSLDAASIEREEEEKREEGKGGEKRGERKGGRKNGEEEERGTQKSTNKQKPSCNGSKDILHTRSQITLCFM